MQTTDSTRFKECDVSEGTATRIGFDELVVGNKVRMAGTVEGETFVATRVIQYIPEE